MEHAGRDDRTSCGRGTVGADASIPPRGAARVDAVHLREISRLSAPGSRLSAIRGLLRPEPRALKELKRVVMKITFCAALGFAIAVVAWHADVAGQQRSAPGYTSAGQLLRPLDYRSWVFLTSGLGMTYGPAKPAADRPPKRNQRRRRVARLTPDAESREKEQK